MAEPATTMLETIREFAAERLHELRGNFEVVAQAHADHYRTLVEPWDVHAPEWLVGLSSASWSNLRAALR